MAGMQSPLELQKRMFRFVRTVEELSLKDGASRGKRIAETLRRNAKESALAYRSACASGTPDSFLDFLSIARSKAKRAKSLLVLLVQLDYLDIDAVRSVITEAKAFENILTAAVSSTRRKRQRSLAKRRATVSAKSSL
jgi:four helix bundle protein